MQHFLSVAVAAVLMSSCAASIARPAANAPPQGACHERASKLQAAVDKARTSPHAVLAVKDAACGSRVYFSGDPKTANADSLFRIGSVTKTYVSALILSLVQDGKIDLTDPVTTWLADLPKAEGITVRMLLNHTSGIFAYSDHPDFAHQIQRKWAPRELVDLALTQESYAAPGKAFHYANTNYILLGMIAERAGGDKLSALIRKRLLAKASLAHTFFDGEEPLGADLAPGYDAAGNDVTHSFDPSVVWAAGAIAARPADVAEWVTALYAGDVLNEQTRALLLQVGPEAYGLGVYMIAASNTVGSGPAIGHNGAVNGYATMAFYFPERRMSLVGVVDQDGADANALLLEALLALRE
jgi:D-alanyl-D-alanine carboxypeptidase